MKRFFTVTTCLFTLVFRILAQEPMVLEFNTSLSAGKTITLPLQGTVNVTVNWGDGNEEAYTFADNYSHTYSEDGTYTVTVSGTLSQFGNGWFGYSNPEKLIRVTNFGELGLESLYGAFYHATNIIEVPTILPATVTNLSEMFSGATSFNSDISNWDVSSVTDISAMFMNASLFNQDISGWNVGSVTSMRYMFYYALEFNQDIGSWDVENVTDMSNMFEGASSFDQNIGAWNVSNVTSMSGMFMPGMFTTVKLSPANYNSLLLGWSAQTLQSNVTFHAGTSKYSPDVAADARGILINTFGWTINDGGTWNLPVLSTAKATSIFATTAKSGGNISANGGSEITARGVVWHTQPNPTLLVNTGYSNDGTGTGAFVSNLTDLVLGETYYVRAYATNSNGTDYGQEEFFETKDPMVLVFNTNLSNYSTITLPLHGDVNVTVNWGDGNEEEFTSAGNRDHIYAEDGTYTVTIGGTLTQFGNGNDGYNNSSALISVESFGDIGITSFHRAFYDAKNLITVPNTIPNTVTNVSGMFYYATSFNQDISNWDVSNIVDFSFMFFYANSFNQDISGWDVSNAIDFNSMFQHAVSFNQDIGGWNVSNAIDMNSMFYDCEVFNKDISGWDLSNVQNIGLMFCGATEFNQDIGIWDVSNVNDMTGLFFAATNFNKYIGDWNVSNVNCMMYMFCYATSFNQDINNWDVSNVDNMLMMFDNASSFNQSLSLWDVSKVPDMSFMFRNASLFNQDISNWDVSNVNNMRSMFYQATAFDQDISNWDVSNVTNMTNMFYGVKLSTAYYNSLLNSWSNLELQNGVTFNGGNSLYSTGSALESRQSIIDTFSWSISDGGISNLPALITTSINDISTSSASSGGIISADGGSEITARGIVWSKSSKPTIDSYLGITNNGTGLGQYSSQISNLDELTRYYVRAYATSSNGTEYGPEMQFTSKKELSISGFFTVLSKDYDGTKAASLNLNNITLDGLVPEFNNVTISNIHLEFNQANVSSTPIPVNIISADIAGRDSDKYLLNIDNAPVSSAYIYQRPLSVSGITAENKIYDGNTSTTILSWGNLTDVIEEDVVSINHSSASASFVDKNVQNNKTITVSGLSIEGISSINYVLNSQNYSATANILPKNLTLTDFSASNKLYDGKTNAIETEFNDNRIIGDDLEFTYSANFSDKNIGELKDVFFTNIEISDGVDKNNYTLNTNTGTAKADIFPKPLLLSSFTASSKVYDGSVDAIGASFSDNRIEGDNLVFAFTSQFTNKNVGVSKNVNFTNISIANGLDKNNYLLSTTSGTAIADITPRTLIFSDFTANNKVYDGTTTVSGTGFNDDRVDGDNLEFTFSAEFSSKSVAEGKNVNFTNISISNGSDKNNYVLASQTGVAVANITPRPLILSSFAADSKVYDGTTEVFGTGFTDDRIDGDILEFTYSAQFSDKNVGESKEVSYSDITISNGTDKDNYSLGTTVGNSTASITTKELTITGTFSALDKVYDGTTSATLDDNNLMLAVPVTGDDVQLFDIIIEFTDASVDIDKTVSIVSADLDGVDKNNYSLSLAGAPTATASITQPVGIPSTSLSEASVYPNPFRDVIHITNSQNAERIVISNIIGKVVLDINLNQSSSQTINTNLPSGIYLVCIIAKDGSRVVRKMVKE